MLFHPLPVPEVTYVPFVSYELACKSLERQRSLEDSEPLEFIFNNIDISELEKAGLL